MIEIKNRWTGKVIVRDEEATTLRDAVIRAVANRTNLSAADLRAADLSAADLRDANLSAANLSAANLSAANLRDANLRAANLSAANLSAANLRDANLRAANLSAANLRAADLSAADLSAADLSDADLSDANEPTPEEYAARAQRYRERHPEIPVVPFLDATICKLVHSGEGHLEMGSWHSCETTHCRAGWAIHQAGEAGYALENKRGPEMAGGMIYKASTGRWPNFFAGNESALADICKWGALDETAAQTAR